MAADLALKDLVWLYLWPPWPLCSSTHQTGVMTLSSFGFNVNTVQHLREIWVDADHNCCFTQCCMLTLLNGCRHGSDSIGAAASVALKAIRTQASPCYQSLILRMDAAALTHLFFQK